MATDPKSPLQQARDYLLKHHEHLRTIGVFKDHWAAAYIHQMLCEATTSRMPEDRTRLDDWHPVTIGVASIVRKHGSVDRRTVVRAVNHLIELGLITKGKGYEDLRFASVDNDSKSYLELVQRRQWALEEQGRKPKPKPKEPAGATRRTVAVRGTPNPAAVSDVEFTG
jgi:DNA-binding MarR family transcriptional regulator